MKKILCGALVLLTAVAAFTSCKKKDNNGDAISSLILSATELQMSPGDDAKKLTVKTNTGTVVTYEWSTDDADNAVITMVAKGSSATITPVGIGTATVTVKVKGNETLTAECTITVVDKMQKLSFSRAVNWKILPLETTDSSKIEIYNAHYHSKYKKYEEGQYDTLFCYHCDCQFSLLADNAFVIGDDGSLAVKDANGAYSIEVTAKIPVIARCLNKELFDSLLAHEPTEQGRQALSNPTYYELGNITEYGPTTWLGDGKDTSYHFATGSINEDKYVEYLGKAYTECWPENPYSEEQSDWMAFWDARDEALANIQGAYLAKWTYSSLSGIWSPSIFPYGIVPVLDFQLRNNTNTEEKGYEYTKVITAANIKVKAFAGYDEQGLDLIQNKVTGKFTLNSQEFQWGAEYDFSF